MMTRDGALSVVAEAAERSGAAVFIGNGLNARAMYQIGPHRKVFYMMGSMGLSLPLAIGFSRFARMVTFAVEGDGNALMGMSAMPLAFRAQPPLVHIILDNQRYESTGGQMSPAPGVRFADVSVAVGYTLAAEVHDKIRLAAVIEKAVLEERICLVHAHTTIEESAPPPPRIPCDPAEITDRFIRKFSESS